MARTSTLHRDLPPRIGIDPGGRRTGLVVAVGTFLLAATVVTNTEPATALGPYATPVSPEYGYPTDVLDKVRATLAHAPWDIKARTWWADRGIHVTADESPWIIGVEKVNLPQENRTKGWVVTPAECLPLIPAAAILWCLLAALPQNQTVIVRPHHADTRWERRMGGTGRLLDYYPAAILEGAVDPSDPERVYPGCWLDNRRFNGTGIKDKAAAWSVASDAAEDWARTSQRCWGRILPPSHAAGCTAQVLAADARSSLQRRYDRSA